MSLSITQVPSSINLSQSPIIFVVSESNPLVMLQTGFQYIGELRYWQGEPTGMTTSYQYQLSKYKNQNDVGIFDVSRIINSLFTQRVLSNVWYFNMTFYTQYVSGTTYVTGTSVTSSTYKAIDGYNIFPEQISSEISYNNSYFPIMSTIPNEMYFNNNNGSTLGLWTGYDGPEVPKITGVTYTKLLNGSVVTGVTYPIEIDSDNYNTGAMITTIPVGPKHISWPLGDMGSNYDFTIKLVYDYTVITPTIFFKNTCEKKYPNICIKWKNRYGCYDYFNFNMISRQGFSVNNSTYSQQIGTWGESTFGYDPAEGMTKNYMMSDEQTLQVNTDLIDESYNNIFKELMVSDDIQWVYVENTPSAQEQTKPLILTSNSVMFKTGVVDKQIQYTFSFKLAQSYKLTF